MLSVMLQFAIIANPRSHFTKAMATSKAFFTSHFLTRVVPSCHMITTLDLYMALPWDAWSTERCFVFDGCPFCSATIIAGAYPLAGCTSRHSSPISVDTQRPQKRKNRLLLAMHVLWLAFSAFTQPTLLPFLAPAVKWERLLCHPKPISWWKKIWGMFCKEDRGEEHNQKLWLKNLKGITCLVCEKKMSW